MKENDKKKLGLYLHIPFCAKKCAYCDFYSFKCPNASLAKNYISALRIQLEDYRKPLSDYEVDTVFIGGGTPSTLDTSLLQSLIDTAGRNLDIKKDAEFTIEVNPGTVTKKALKKYRKMGINRLSIGLQSIHEDELRELGRIHTLEDFTDCYEWAREVGFDNISVDLMYGIPRQTKGSFAKTLDFISKINPEHVSIYALKVEEGTEFYNRRDALDLPDEDTEYEMYTSAIDFLGSRGYEHYEISNFARPGYRCRHNMKYWNCDEYLGLGPGAHSYLDERRFAVARDIVKYIDGIEIVNNNINIYSEDEQLTVYERMSEYIMLRMRLSDGVTAAKFNRRFGFDFEEKYGARLREYIDGGFVEFNGGTYSFTPKGMYVSNYILSSVLDFDGENIPKSF